MGVQAEKRKIHESGGISLLSTPIMNLVQFLIYLLPPFLHIKIVFLFMNFLSTGFDKHQEILLVLSS
jgi:hypothetical protein